MATAEQKAAMTDEGRALLTERERQILSGKADVSDNYRYKVESTVRVRIRNSLGKDVSCLQEHFQEAYELVREVACDE